jgi:hypothetical protein
VRRLLLAPMVPGMTGGYLRPAVLGGLGSSQPVEVGPVEAFDHLIFDSKGDLYGMTAGDG